MRLQMMMYTVTNWMQKEICIDAAGEKIIQAYSTNITTNQNRSHWIIQEIFM
jgi:hypothetical protein